MNERDRRSFTDKTIQEKSQLLWNIADVIRGLYKPHEYGELIIPMTVIKRFNDVLEQSHDEVLEANKRYGRLPESLKNEGLIKASGYPFYNTSAFTFKTLVSDADNIQENFLNFINGFSDNVHNILKHFDMENQINKLSESGKLYQVISEFNSEKGYLGSTISSTDMGYIFEDLVKRFSESYNEDAGAHFTSRDIIYLMTDILISEKKEVLENSEKAFTVYDQTMGTSQMLTAMKERIEQLNINANVSLYGTELNPKTYALAMSDALIRNENPNNLKLGNTLTQDMFPDMKFDFGISNPPFGIDWKSEYDIVRQEHLRGEHGRFEAGLPKKSDGQLLFMQNGLSKLKDDGRMAIIHNGSALFSGAAGSGESKIRQHIIENDWLEAIIQLPNDSFYNTGITTYIWIVSKEKAEHRKGFVQLIDASNMFEKRRKAIGSKRNDISEECRELIVKAYSDFENAEYTLDDRTLSSKVFENASFGFTKVTVESPLKDEEGNVVLKKGVPAPDTSLRDTEDIPLTQDVEEYFKREILPFNTEAWLDRSKDKVGFEIPFTRLFYKYETPEKSEDIAERIKNLEAEIVRSFEDLTGKEVVLNG